MIKKDYLWIEEQFEAEMMQLEREIQSRQFDADRFYDDSLAELAIEADRRLQELESSAKLMKTGLTKGINRNLLNTINGI